MQTPDVSVLVSVFRTDAPLHRRCRDWLETNQIMQSMSYSNTGNIASKQDVGGYAYAQNTCGRVAGPHAVTGAGGVSYCYDANGNQTSSSDGRSLSYSVFDKPLSMSSSGVPGAAGDTAAFSYGTGREMVRRVDGNGPRRTRDSRKNRSQEKAQQHGVTTRDSRNNTGQSKKSESRKGWSAERWRELCEGEALRDP